MSSDLFQLSHDHHKNVLFYDLNEIIDEEKIVKCLKSNELIASFYIVNDKRNLIVISKDRTKNKEIEELIKNNSDYIKCSLLNQMPYSNFNSVLLTEVTDNQLKRLSKDKSVALKMIESQTGLKLKKQKKQFFFNGLMYQFILLNDLFSKYPEIAIQDEPTGAVSIQESIKSSEQSQEEEEKIVLIGSKEDLNSFYDINSNHIKSVEKDDNNTTTWTIVEFNRENDVKTKPIKQQKSQINSFGPEFTITLNSNDNKRFIKGDSLPKMDDLFCNICQTEDADDLIKCSNSTCKIAFCKKCFNITMKNKRSSKCPNCPSKFELNFELSKGFSRGIVEHSFIDDQLPGYGRIKTIEFYYFCNNGVQTNDDPEPGVEYRGTEKFWYVPANNEGKDLIGLFQKAHKKGLLFHLDLNRNTNVYSIFINKNVVLKTDPWKGGRYGYPDQNYVQEITKTLKDLLQEA